MPITEKDPDKVRPPKPAGLQRRTERKATFGNLFALLAVTLVLLPFVTTFNEFLTRVVEKSGFYMVIQGHVVPVLTRMMVLILSPLNIDVQATYRGLLVNGRSVRLSWNCLGWQSLVLLFISLITGLQGPYTLLSKFEVILTGFLGIFLMNLIRLSGIVVLSVYVSQVASLIFHDYFSNVMIIGWLFFFWWYSFKFVLVRKQT